MMKFTKGTLVNVLRNLGRPSPGALTLTTFLVVAFVGGIVAQGPPPPAPVPVVPASTLIAPATPEKAPDAAGFIQRWLLLEPIDANGLTDSVVQATVKKEYFPNQFTVV